MRVGDEIGENFLLVKISGYMVHVSHIDTVVISKTKQILIHVNA